MSDFNQYKQYINALFQPTDTIAFMFSGEVDGKKSIGHEFVPASEATTQKHFDRLNKLNAILNIYVAMNPYKPELVGQGTGRTKDNVAEIKRVYAEVDENGLAVKDAILSSDKVPTPNVVMESSPGKYQFIWNVEGFTRETVEPLLKTIATEFHTDPAVAEVARVLRVPGFINRKYADAPEVKLTQEIDDHVYMQHDFNFPAKAVTESSEFEPRPELPRDESNLIPHGYIHKFLLREAGRLRDMGLINEETIYTALSELTHAQCAPPIDESKVRAMAKSAMTWPVGRNPALFTSADKDPDPLPPIVWRDQFRTVGQLEKGEVRMLINGFMPEGTNYLGGLPGGGKTLLALSITKALTTGQPFLGRTDFTVPHVTPVLYLIPEVGGRAFRQRLIKFGIPDDPKLFLCRTISEGSTLSLNDPALIAAAAEMKPVVFLDTAIRFNSSNDENSATQNRSLVDAMIVLRQMGAVSVIALHHSAKSMRENGMTLENILRGTGDMAASADCVYGLLRDEKLYDEGRGPEEIDIRCVKPRDFTPPPPFRIAASRKVPAGTMSYYKPGLASNIDDYGDLSLVADDTRKTEMMNRLDALLHEDPKRNMKELQEATGFKTYQIRTLLKALGWVKPKSSDVWRKGVDIMKATPIKVHLDDEEPVTVDFNT